MTAPAGAPAPHLYDRITSPLLWLAAFSFATGVFFSFTLFITLLSEGKWTERRERRRVAPPLVGPLPAPRRDAKGSS